MKKFKLFKLLALFIVLITSINQAWANDPKFAINGDPISTWTTTNYWYNNQQSYKLVSPAEDNWDRYCAYMWMENNAIFGINDGSKRYSPSVNQTAINGSSGSGNFDYNGDNAWKYTGAAGLVKVCVDQSTSNDKPWLWVVESQEVEILRGNKIMFYFGPSTSKGKTWMYLSTTSKTSHGALEQYHKLPDEKCSSNISVAYVDANTSYYISDFNGWGGVQMDGNAAAGNLYSLYNDGQDKIYCNTGSIPAFSSATYNHATGVAVSSISATASNSIYGNSQEIKYYYTTSSTPGSASFTAFDPNDISGLSAGTYYIYALGWDGHILVRSAAATLTVADAPGISLSIEDGSDNVITAARSGDVITLKATPVNCGSTPTISYRYSTSSSFDSYTQIESTTSTSTTWTVPASTSNVTYYLRAYVTSSGYLCNTANSTLTTYGKKTIHVRDNNKWGSLKIHHWGANDIDKTTWGSLPSCTSDGGQWYSVVIYNCASNFVLTNEGGSDKDKTIDLAYGQSNPTLTDGAYYEMSTNPSTKQTLSASSAPAAPTVTLTTTIRQNQISLKGTITAYNRDGTNVDDMTEVGFYIDGVKQAASCDNNANEFYYTKTGLTANTQYSIYAFAESGAGGKGKSTTATPTTLATSATHKLKVQVPDGVTPYVYTYCDNFACSEGSLQNATFPGQAATLLVNGVSNDWYEFDIHDQYDKFIVSKDDKGTKQTANIVNPRENICRWYSTTPDDEHKDDRFGTMACPVEATSLYIGDKDAADGDHDTYTMTGTTTMSKTLSLAANHNYEFKVIYNAEYYGKTSSTTVNRDGKTNNVVSAGTASAGASYYIYLHTDLAGSYTITFNESTKAVSVTYPEAYVMTYSAILLTGSGTACSAPSAATSTSVAVSSGDLVLDGTSMTFTAASANTGYTFQGWFDKADPTLGTDDPISSDDDVDENVYTYTETVSDAAITVYAIYTEDMHDVTVNAQTGGTVSYDGGDAGSSCTANAGISTASASIVATAATGYYFVGWQLPDGTITKASESSYNGATSTYTINATADSKTVVALFNVRYALLGSLDDYPDNTPAGMPGWGEANEAPFTYSAGTYTKSVSLTKPNTNYKFRVVDRRGASHTNYGLLSKTVISADGNYHDLASTAADALLATAGVGSYTLTVQTNASGYPKVMITNPTSHLITMGVKTDHGANDDAGGSISAVDGEDTPNPISNGKYIKDGGSIVVTASPTTPGYSLAGWYSNSDCSTPLADDEDAVDLTYTKTNIQGALSVYAKFTENMTDVTLAHTGNGSIKIGEDVVTSTTVGVYTTRTITAVPDAGWYFAGWTVSDGADCSVASTDGRGDNEPSSTTLTGLGAGTTGTVTAKFMENEKIYFRNENETTGEKLWNEDNIYVYFNVGWGIVAPSSYSGVTTSAGKFAQMSPISSGSKIYWAYIPHAITEANYTNIAFSDKWMGSTYPDGLYGEFYQNQGVYRTDYNKHLNMYVPACKSSNSDNDTKYYSHGFWMKYNNRVGQDASYYLKEGDKNNQVDVFKATADNSTLMVAKYRFQNTSAHTFFIANAAGKFYKASATITNAACTNVNVIDDAATPVGFTITPTSEGYYTFYIEQAGDTMKLSINYPISPGDYRLDYTHDTNKHLYSDVIKPDNASSTNVKKSVYIDPGTTGGSLKLQKCTGLDGSANPIWTSGVSVGTLGTVFTNGKGVYEFDMAITDGTGGSSDVSSVTLSNVKLYTGNFYIKTDYAPGGWVNYEQNALEQNTINFSKSDSKTFDYYFCAWVDGDGKNVKCIIANDYNQQLTDTLIGDDVLGLDGGNPRQYLATAANVRFSYNSYTNELKRTYINGATGWEASFLSLKDMYTDGTHGGSSGTTSITKSSGTALTEDTITFKDKGNWIYQINVKAIENAHIYLSANYKFNSTDHVQDLIGTSSTGSLLIGKGLGASPQKITVIYDFKTNNLIAAWNPEGEYDEVIDLSSDVLLIHNRKSDGSGDVIDKIDLTGSGQIKDINRVYSALRFQKTDGDGWLGLSGNLSGATSAAQSANSYYRYNYWISFPYDVKMTDIFGVAGYGSKWRIQYYDGKERASKGWYKDDGTTTFWKTMPMSDDAKLNKGEGYVLQLSPSAFKATGDGSLWALVDEIYLYFPSKANFGVIGQNTSTVILSEEGYVCTKGLFSDPVQKAKGYSHDVTDSHWHVFGIPTFSDATGTTGTGTYYYDNDDDDYPTPQTPPIVSNTFYFYQYENSNNSSRYNVYTATSSSGFTFQPMHAYMIQMTGTLNFTTNSVPASVAARRTPEKENYNVQIELQNEDIVRDQAFVTLREEAVAGFAFNEDLMKIHNDGKTNIYSYAGPYDVAANIMPVENHTVALGIEAAASGTYTFHMPSNFSGTVTLFDNVENTRTNLALNDYTIFLNKGTYEGRFYLELDIHKMPTSIDVIEEGGSLKDGKAHKFIQNGVMYILRDGVIYDAQGAKVK